MRPIMAEVGVGMASEPEIREVELQASARK